MSKQLFEKKGITVTRFWAGEGKGFRFQVTWGWRDNEFVHTESRKQAFVLAHFLLGGKSLNI